MIVAQNLKIASCLLGREEKPYSMGISSCLWSEFPLVKGLSSATLAWESLRCDSDLILHDNHLIKWTSLTLFLSSISMHTPTSQHKEEVSMWLIIFSAKCTFPWTHLHIITTWCSRCICTEKVLVKVDGIQCGSFLVLSSWTSHIRAFCQDVWNTVWIVFNTIFMNTTQWPMPHLVGFIHMLFFFVAPQYPLPMLMHMYAYILELASIGKYKSHLY